MRLSLHEVQAIRDCTLKLDPQAKIYLYGSRANDSLKGGDIDLLILSDDLTFGDKITLLVDIKLVIGEQKIDLTTAPHDSAKHSAFIAGIFPKALQL